MINDNDTVNQDIKHLLDIESKIKSWLNDFLDKNNLSKDDYKYLKPCGRKRGIMYGLCKIHNVPQLMTLYPLFNLF